jgi:hypothetical protein
VGSGVTHPPELQRTLDVVGDKCLDGVIWQPDYHRCEWPIRLEANVPRPFLSLRGLRIAQALEHSYQHAASHLLVRLAVVDLLLCP